MKELDLRIQNLQKHSLTAFYYFNKGENEIAVQNARKAAEAICRSIILKDHGEILGLEIIEGRKDKNGNAIAGYITVPLLSDLLFLVEGTSNVTRDVLNKIRDIKDKGNEGSHDPLNNIGLLEYEEASFCMKQLQMVLEWFYKNYIERPIPKVVLEAFKGKIDKALTIEKGSEGWERLFSECECFSDDYEYIMIAPPSWNPYRIDQLSVFSKIHWSSVFDFNPDSKESGLFKAFKNASDNIHFKPLTILQKDENDLINTSRFNTNWIFANGLSELPLTQSKDFRDWKLNLKYGIFYKN
ncbi:MAG: hypothetical protein Q8867_11435 [Bacteroidota bacterium]|nr:hypothetical protein [Bacteroidota bacterium]